MAQYFVLPDGQRWQIRHKDKIFPYSTRQTAMRAAVDVAQKAGELGHPAEVLVQAPDGDFHVLWKHGRDVYPHDLELLGESLDSCASRLVDLRPRQVPDQA